MAITSLKDQDRLDEASNFFIWKARINFLLDEHGLKAFLESVIVGPIDPKK